MASIDRRLEMVIDGPVDTVVAVLGAALAHADSAERPALTAALVATGRPDAVSIVVRHLHRLGPEGRRCLRRARSSWRQAIHTVLTTGRRLPALNALAVVRSEGDASLAPLLVDPIGSDDPAIAIAAARALLAVTRREVGPHGRRDLDENRRRDLDTALAGVARTYRTHRQEPALLAIALCARRPGQRLACLLDDPEEPIALALMRLPGREAPSIVRDNLIDWLDDARLGRPAARALARSHAPAELSDILERGHLLPVPARSRMLRQLERSARCLPAVPASVGLAPEAQARLPRYIDATGLAPAEAVRKLGQCRRLASPIARALALHRLLGRTGPEVREVIATFTHDADARIAHAAARRLHRDPPGLPTPLAARLEGGPHETVARLATVALAGATVETFFDRWLELTGAERVAVARRLLSRDRPQFAAQLLELVVGADVATRLHALLLARRLGLTAPPPPEVLVEVKNADPRIAATVMATLGDGSSGGGDAEVRRRMIAFGLHHADARVRANAVEVARATELAAEWSRVRDLAGDFENRPRGNAIVALCRHRPDVGLPLLDEMLRDPNPLHRVSAVWAARRTRMAPVIGRLRWMARQDRVELIRRRAARAATLMLDPDQVAAPSTGASPPVIATAPSQTAEGVAR